MTCRQAASENIIELYLAATLDETTRDAFERHYFACESCLAQLQSIQTLQPVLATLPPPVPRSTPKPNKWLWPIAAALALAYFAWPQPAPPQFAALEPPPYRTALLRGTASQPSPAFEAAMALYSSGQFRLAGLANPNPASRHFTALSLLLAGRIAASRKPKPNSTE